MDNGRMSSEQDAGAAVESGTSPLPPRRGLVLVGVAAVVLVADVLT